MNPAIRVAVAATPDVTRLVAMWGAHEVLRARLGPPSQVHRLAAPLLLEGLALWYQQPLHVVLGAECEAISSGLQLSDGFGFGCRTLYYEVEVLASRGCGAEFRGDGAFRALRRLCQRERS